MEYIVILTLLIIQIILIISIMYQKDLYFNVLYLTMASLIAAVLYTIFNAPDIALAEIAVGCALIPFVYIIAITKQKDLFILDEIEDELSARLIEDIRVLCKNEKLKIRLISEKNIHDFELKDVFRKLNVDIIIKKVGNKHELICKETSELNDHLIQLLKQRTYTNIIDFIRIGDDVQED
ncbi:MAG: DUF4040 domain-containing protein [Clostridiales bacterium]|nr:DUF4040 domain-containing protein [Clostridiales bacterium]